MTLTSSDHYALMANQLRTVIGVIDVAFGNLDAMKDIPAEIDRLRVMAEAFSAKRGPELAELTKAAPAKNAA